jgi:hypothetical protein
MKSNISYHLKNSLGMNELDRKATVAKMETVRKIRTVRMESERCVEIELAEGPLVANLATTQHQQNPTIAKKAQVEGVQHPTIADFATVELVANCDKSGQWVLNLVASLKEAALPC